METEVLRAVIVCVFKIDGVVGVVVAASSRCHAQKIVKYA